LLLDDTPEAFIAPMKTVFVYEHCTAMGLGRSPSDPAHSLYREGKAMRDAVMAEFGRLEGVVTETIEDSDFNSYSRLIHNKHRIYTAVVLIAPEIEDELIFLCDNTDDTGVFRLGCSLEAIELTSDKLKLAEHWLLNFIPTPITQEADPTLRFPAVVKRIDGAGSTDTSIINDLDDWCEFELYAKKLPGKFILQPYIPGRPASVAFLVGSQQTIPLLPCWQHIADDGRFTYLGGEIIDEDALLMRAVKLAQRAIDCVPGLLGYVGVDLILGQAADGSEDYALEINPRLTTSYVGLRAMTDDNLMEIMWALCRGESGFRITWKPDRVRFQADGTVERISQS
jgi:tyramine---L-glutamate ligase